MVQPLLHEAAAEQRRQQRALHTGLRTTDPMAESTLAAEDIQVPRPKATSKSRTSHPRGRGARGRGRSARPCVPHPQGQGVAASNEQLGDDHGTEVCEPLADRKELRDEVMDIADFEAESLPQSDAEEMDATFDADGSPEDTREANAAGDSVAAFCRQWPRLGVCLARLQLSRRCHRGRGRKWRCERLAAISNDGCCVVLGRAAPRAIHGGGGDATLAAFVRSQRVRLCVRRHEGRLAQPSGASRQSR